MSTTDPLQSTLPARHPFPLRREHQRPAHARAGGRLRGPGRPCVLLLHGFPGTGLQLAQGDAAAGRGRLSRDRARPARLRPHHRLGRPLRRRPRALPHAQPGARRARAGVGAGLPLGGRGGRPRLRLAGGGLVRADPARRVPLGRADERAVSPGRRALPFDTADAPPQPAAAPDCIHDELAALPRAAQALPVVLLDARGQRQHAARARRACTTSCAPTTTTRAPTGRATSPFRCRRWTADRTGQAADLLRDGAGPGHGRDRGAGDADAAADRRLQMAARRRACASTAREFARTGFQGGLQWYRCEHRAA